MSARQFNNFCNTNSFCTTVTQNKLFQTIFVGRISSLLFLVYVEDLLAKRKLWAITRFILLSFFFSLFPSSHLSVMVCVSLFFFLSLSLQTLLCLKEWGGWAVRVHNPTWDVTLVGCGLSSMFLLSRPNTLEAQVHTNAMDKKGNWKLRGGLRVRALWGFANKLAQKCLDWFNITQRKDNMKTRIYIYIMMTFWPEFFEGVFFLFVILSQLKLSLIVAVWKGIMLD